MVQVVGGLIERAVRPFGELVDLAHHRLLMALGLRSRRIVVEHGLDRFVGVGPCIGPALHRCLDELRHRLDEGRVLELVLSDIEAVFEGGDTLVLIFEDDEVLRLHPRLDDLPVLVIGHGRDAVGLLLQQRIDIEALLEHRHAVGSPGRRYAELAHPRQEGIFIAVEPHAERLALEVGRRLDPGLGPAGELHARPLERLGDIDERHALLARRKCGRHPVDDDIGATAGNHLLGGDVGTARLDRHFEAGILVVALGLRHVIAGELRLGDPFELERHVLGRSLAHARRQCGQTCRTHQKSVHLVLLSSCCAYPVICVSDRTDAKM